jgi:hypothetical protein
MYQVGRGNGDCDEPLRAATILSRICPFETIPSTFGGTSGSASGCPLLKNANGQHPTLS